MRLSACVLLASVVLTVAFDLSAASARSVPRSVEEPTAYTASALPQLSEPAQEEFVPIDELPPEDQLAAAPLLVTSYAFAWVAILGYLWSIWRRLGHVERELSEVARYAEDRRRT